MSKLKKSGRSAKETKFYNTLQNAEYRQLESFIKTRSRQLDGEIKVLKESLAAKGKNFTAENDSLQNASEAHKLNLQGEAIGKIALDPDYLSRETRKAGPSISKMKIDLDKSKTHPVSKDLLVQLLAKMKLSKLE